MVILEDTRQQAGKHEGIRKWMESSGILMDRCTLYVGDYIIANDGHISVDIKQDVLQLIQDIYHDHVRFRNECVRAKVAGIRLIILVQEELPQGRIDLWEPPLRRNGTPASLADPKRLRKAMITMQNKYGVCFRFCPKEEAGRYIVEYLTGLRQI